MKLSGAWIRRFGLAGFVFFLAKGILWLGVGALAIQGCRGE